MQLLKSNSNPVVAFSLVVIRRAPREVGGEPQFVMVHEKLNRGWCVTRGQACEYLWTKVY